MDVQPNWWSTFFSGPAVDLWVHALPPEHTAAQAEYAIRRLELRPGAAVLDVPCGAGRIAIALAAKGCLAVGVDLSSEFLEHARRADPEGRVEWHRRDMRDLPWTARFDAALCLGNSFGYLDDDGNEAFVAALARTLKPGGRAIVETPAVAESLLTWLPERLWAKAGDVYLLVANQYDHQRARLDTEYTFVQDGRITTRTGTQRVYAYRQLVELFGAAGFVVDSAEAFGAERGVNPYVNGELATKPYAAGSRVLLLTLRRA